MADQKIRVVHMPCDTGVSFYVDVRTKTDGLKVLRVLADYDESKTFMGGPVPEFDPIQGWQVMTDQGWQDVEVEDV